ncbi:MAG: type II toxin-antitoxin system VapC family toxin [Actinobacteria bacterium]|nr:MAG: type II toxin-antitoxin system VapC family toxin [Actinomycetota bacterium]
MWNPKGSSTSSRHSASTSAASMCRTRATAERWVPRTALSFGDRACLALAARVGGTAVTTEHGWFAAAPDVSVAAIR